MEAVIYLSANVGNIWHSSRSLLCEVRQVVKDQANLLSLVIAHLSAAHLVEISTCCRSFDLCCSSVLPRCASLRQFICSPQMCSPQMCLCKAVHVLPRCASLRQLIYSPQMCLFKAVHLFPPDVPLLR